jgi:hypothetical protein
MRLLRRSGNLAAFLLAMPLACCGAPPSGAHWKVAGGLDGDFVQFVEVEPAFAKTGAVYREAVERLCPGQDCYQIGFFVAGDQVPPSGSRGDFFQAGGWAGYAPAAVYNGSSSGKGEFTKWDCAKAGKTDAPLSALCGKDAEEEYDATLRLATREAWTQACGLTATDSRDVFYNYVEQAGMAKSKQLKAAYEQMYDESLTGPDDHEDCARLRSKIEEAGRSARKFMVAHTAKARARQ